MDEVAREVQTYAMARLPHAEPALEMAGAAAGIGSGTVRKESGLIEID